MLVEGRPVPDGTCVKVIIGIRARPARIARDALIPVTAGTTSVIQPAGAMIGVPAAQHDREEPPRVVMESPVVIGSGPVMNPDRPQRPGLETATGSRTGTQGTPAARPRRT